WRCWQPTNWTRNLTARQPSLATRFSSVARRTSTASPPN
ncbi:uncharacterized protein METZ01_LOCUS190783, partial [marine metagenome]